MNKYNSSLMRTSFIIAFRFLLLFCITSWVATYVKCSADILSGVAPTVSAVVTKTVGLAKYGEIALSGSSFLLASWSAYNFLKSNFYLLLVNPKQFAVNVSVYAAKNAFYSLALSALWHLVQYSFNIYELKGGGNSPVLKTILNTVKYLSGDFSENLLVMSGMAYSTKNSDLYENKINLQKNLYFDNWFDLNLLIYNSVKENLTEDQSKKCIAVLEKQKIELMYDGKNIEKDLEIIKKLLIKKPEKIAEINKFFNIADNGEANMIAATLFLSSNQGKTSQDKEFADFVQQKDAKEIIGDIEYFNENKAEEIHVISKNESAQKIKDGTKWMDSVIDGKIVEKIIPQKVYKNVNNIAKDLFLGLMSNVLPKNCDTLKIIQEYKKINYIQIQNKFKEKIKQVYEVLGDKDALEDYNNRQKGIEDAKKTIYKEKQWGDYNLTLLQNDIGDFLKTAEGIHIQKNKKVSEEKIELKDKANNAKIINQEQNLKKSN